MKQLIFDIGMHNGDDSAYYLDLGYRVLGVEANPQLAEMGRQRFAKEISQEIIKILNVGILSTMGEFTFYKNLTDDGCSSFYPEYGKQGERWEELTVPCVTMDRLIQEYGVPFFIKIDIEGADFQALDTLTSETAPRYISLELSTEDQILDRLITLGYTRFKIVSGKSFRTSEPIWNYEWKWRLARKVGRAIPQLHKVMSKIQKMNRKAEFDLPCKYSPDRYAFSRYSSGPFGEKAYGSWLSSDAALHRFQHLKHAYEKAGQTKLFWWDVHARR